VGARLRRVSAARQVPSDLNPVAAGIAAVPEASEHTSIKERVDHVKA